MGLKIVGLGHSLGKKLVTNDELSKRVETSDQWITSRTGIKQRYYADNEQNSDMATEAAASAIKNSNISTEDIGVCIICTFTPDEFTPAVACTVAGNLGLPEDVMAFDINAACTGFLFGLNVAKGLLENSKKKYALVVGSEHISKLLNMDDPSTSVLFGDGAGGAVVELSAENQYGFLGGCKPDREVLHCTIENSEIKMNGKDVFRFAVDAVPKAINNLLEQENLQKEEIDYFVCHQANERIISNVIKQLDQDSAKFYMNIHNYGNTSAASIPIALSEMMEKGMLTKGKKIVCVGFGAGLTYGASLLSW